VAHAIREDGAYVEMGENDNAIIGKLVNDPNAVGVFGFSFLDQNMDKIKGAAIDGKMPTFEGIADSSYPISRPLQFYVKKAHVGKINGMKEYLAEFTSEAAFGDGGYLSDKGLIPMPKAERECNRAAAMNLTPMAGYDYACGK
jgi:phosphate transport system substrate-binding protein